MRNNIFEEESDSSDSSENSPYQQRNHYEYSSENQSPLERLISINVTIFNDLGFEVCSDSFRSKPGYDDEELQNEDSDSERSDIDYGDSEEEESQPVMEVDGNQDYLNGEVHVGQRLTHRQYSMIDQFSVEESNNESPFFPQIMKQDGMSIQQIDSLPTMEWSNAHNIFNRGEKCPVCLEEFQLGNHLRVMECLHRYHSNCLDQWLSLRASCPSCRTPPNRP